MLSTRTFQKAFEKGSRERARGNMEGKPLLELVDPKALLSRKERLDFRQQRFAFLFERRFTELRET
jgi:hypothetical protein